jgi:hypothetical protein
MDLPRIEFVAHLHQMTIDTIHQRSFERLAAALGAVASVREFAISPAGD